MYVLGSFIFGLPSDRPETFDATALAAAQAEVAFAQFVMLTPILVPWTLTAGKRRWRIPRLIRRRIPITRRWLISAALRPKLYWPHPTMSAEEIRERTQSVWDTFYSLKYIWARSGFIKSMRARLAFVLISKIYRQMYADTGIATDSATGLALSPLGALAGQALSTAVCGPSDATPEAAGGVGRTSSGRAGHFGELSRQAAIWSPPNSSSPAVWTGNVVCKCKHYTQVTSDQLGEVFLAFVQLINQIFTHFVTFL